MPERDTIVAWLRGQSDKGANAALGMSKGSTARASYGGDSLALKLAADACRAAKALGYSEAWTYTLPGENGASLRAAGFTYMGETKGGEWDRPSRPRSKAVRSEKKGRWMRQLSTIGPKRGCNLDPALSMNESDLRYAY